MNKFHTIENEKVDQTFCKMDGGKNETLILQLEFETTILQNKIPEFEIKNQEEIKLPNPSIEHTINIIDPGKTENYMPLDLSKIKSNIDNIVQQLSEKTADSDLGPPKFKHPLLTPNKKQLELKATNQVLRKDIFKKFKDFEPKESLDTYKKPPQTMKFKENPVRDAGKNFKCTMCNRVCSSMQNLKEHIIKYHSEHFNCPKCSKSFALEDSNAFKLHLFKHEFILTPRPNQCIHCGKVFAFNKILQKHMKKAGPFHADECVQCPFKFTNYEVHSKHIEESHFGKWRFR